MNQHVKYERRHWPRNYCSSPSVHMFEAFPVRWDIVISSEGIVVQCGTFSQNIFQTINKSVVPS